MKLLLITLLAALVQTPTPSAVARLCGNMVVHQSSMEKVVARIHAQGCNDVTVVPLQDGYVLAYGVKVLIGE